MALTKVTYSMIEDAPIDVRNFGAVGDGITDDTDAFDEALQTAAGTGTAQRLVYVPPGQYRLTRKITIPAFVKMQGMNWLPDPSNLAQTLATSLYIDWGAGQNNHAIEMSSSSAIEGFTIYYPGQAAKTDATPIEFGFSIATPSASGIYDNIQINYITLYNSYRGIRMNNGGRYRISNIQGQPLFLGITTSDCFDAASITNVHFWDFWTQSDTLFAWVKANATALEMWRVDDLKVENIIALGYNIGYYCRDNLWASMVNIQTDTCNYPFIGVLCSRVSVTNFEFLGSAAARPGVWLLDSGTMEFCNGRITDHCPIGFQVEGPSTTLISNVKFNGQGPAVVAVANIGNEPDIKISNCDWVYPPFGTGNVMIDGNQLPGLSTAITLPSPTLSGGVTSIASGYQFDLTGTSAQNIQYAFASIGQRNSLYVLEFDYDMTVFSTTWYFRFNVQTDIGTYVQVAYGQFYPLNLNTSAGLTPKRVRIPFFANFGEYNQVMNIYVEPTVGVTGSYLKLTNIALYEQRNIDTTDAQVAMMMNHGYNNDAYGMGQTLMAKGKNRVVLTKPEPGIGRTTEVPTTGTWEVGDEVRVYNPVSGGYIGYVCTTAGTPGTWKAFGAIV